LILLDDAFCSVAYTCSIGECGCSPRTVSRCKVNIYQQLGTYAARALRISGRGDLKMERLRGATAGFVTGIVISPLVCFVVFLFTLLLGLLALTDAQVFLQLNDRFAAYGNLYEPAVLTTWLVATAAGTIHRWRMFGEREQCPQG
jgi:hypothetical protein